MQRRLSRPRCGRPCALWLRKRRSSRPGRFCSARARSSGRQRTEADQRAARHLANSAIVAAMALQHVKQLVVIGSAGAANCPRWFAYLRASSISSRSRDCPRRLRCSTRTIRSQAGHGEIATRLRTMPGVGPITRDGDRDLRAADGGVPPGPRLRRLARSRASKSRPVASRSSARPRRWDNATSDGC